MTKELSLESLGISQEDLAERLVNKLAEGLLSSLDYDEDGYEFRGESPFAKKLNVMVKDRINALVEDLGNKHVLPRVTEMVEGLVLTETNRWGEKTGKSVTFTEYLVQRAEAYMVEPVDYNGKDKAGGDYNWKASTTRVGHLVHAHLRYSIETAMKAALADANSQIVTGLEGAVKIALGSVRDKLKVTVAA